MLRAWTIGRATGVGVTAALASLIVWPFYSGAQDPLQWPLSVVALLAALSGISILLITASDMLFHRRGARIRPLRGFDIVLGIGLTTLGLFQLNQLLGQLPVR